MTPEKLFIHGMFQARFEWRLEFESYLTGSLTFKAQCKVIGAAAGLIAITLHYSPAGQVVIPYREQAAWSRYVTHYVWRQTSSF